MFSFFIYFILIYIFIIIQIIMVFFMLASDRVVSRWRAPSFFMLDILSLDEHTEGQKILKNPGQKNSWNQINQFHEKIFWPNFIFCHFKNDQKSIFELRKSLKLPKMQFHGNLFIYLFILFHNFFMWNCIFVSFKLFLSSKIDVWPFL